MSLKIPNSSLIKKELFTLSVLRYNRIFYKSKDKEKFLDFHKQVDIQEYYLFHKYKLVPVQKEKKDIILTLNHLSHQFHNPKFPYILYNNGTIYKKTKNIKNYIFSEKLEFPIKIQNNLSYCNVNKEVYNYFSLYFSILESL